jgi:hypothetical protein
MKKVIPRPNWRCRREEYLRAAGRRDELISEGYEDAPASVQWIVLPAGDMRTAKGLHARSRFAS